MALQAKKYKPELAIILHSHLPYDVLFAVMAGCQYILRNTSDIIPKWFQNGLLLIIIQLEVMLFKSKLDIIGYLGIDSTDTRMELPCKIESLAQSKNSIVGFQMGASTQERRWPVVSFVELAKKLIDSAPSLQIKANRFIERVGIARRVFALLPERYHQNIENLVGKNLTT